METGLLIFAIIVMFVIMLLLHTGGYERGYKEGQIDAINGIIKYTLVEFKDGEREYYQTKDLKDLKEYKIIEK